MVLACKANSMATKGYAAEEDASAVHLLGSYPNRGETVALIGAECCGYLRANIIILHELPVYKPVFFVI